MHNRQVTERKGRMAWGAWLVAAAMAASCAQGDEVDQAGYVPVDEPDASASGGKAGSAGGSSNTGGTGGSSGSTGKGGAAGSSGSSGAGGTSTGGAAGASGAASGGAAGTAGTAQGGSSGHGGASGSAGAGGAAGSSGTGGGAGSAGAAGNCTQADGEVNDSLDQAIEKPGITDCDGAGSSFSGTLKSATDQDWFKFHGNDNMGCQVNPTFEPDSSGTLVVCAYFECDSGTTSPDCGSDADPAVSPTGLSGCCASAAFSAGVNCSGTLEDSSTVYVQVKSASNNVNCLGYTISYHY